jgi:hypothetical protein
MNQDFVLPILEAVFAGLITMVAAFGGAWYAFRLSDKAKARETEQAQVAAINRAQFTLIQQINTLRFIDAQIVEPVRSHSGRFIAMRPGLPVTATSRLDIDSLLFLLETEDRELLFRLLVEQQRFDEALKALNERSHLHINILQPKLVAAGIQENREYSSEELIRALGPEFATRLERLTDDTILHIEKNIESGLALVGEFHAKMKARFPKRSIIRLDPDRPFS